MQIERIPVKKNSKKKDNKDRRQYNRLFRRRYRGGLPKHIIEEYKRIHSK
ncbi:MAG: hypothetical protein Unbinned200contig1002_24 [Prokaryotic dsDNA virus sp.]|jgi:hypothetical protein|nr:MAG: hypothetical protein Unbinned200contig1002_24 [Prokaryotic dsDNA virus sp.]